MDRRVLEVMHLLESCSASLPLRDPSRDLARSVALSASRLRHIFKRETGVTPAQFLGQKKLEQARELLETSHLSVKEVAAQVGIPNQSHFVRVFKKAYGLPPGRYGRGSVETKWRFHPASK